MEALQKFKVDALELIAVAALVDPSATASILATHVNYKVVARSGSKEVAVEAQKLLNAVAQVPDRVGSFLEAMDRARAEELNDSDDANETDCGNHYSRHRTDPTTILSHILSQNFAQLTQLY